MMPRLPSSDLYFANACAPLIARWWDLPGMAANKPLQRLSANSFATQGPASDSWLVLVRRDSHAAMTRALRWPGRLAYVVDDDIAGAADSPSLPASYRARLDTFDWDWHSPLLARADVVLTASDVLAQRLTRRMAPHGPQILRIDPVWHADPAPLDHFAGLDGGAPFKIAHLGTGSHRGALARLAPAMADILRSHPHVSFTYVAPRGEHDPLAGLPRAHRVAPRPWPAWRCWLAEQRFHLALYPLLDEPFDRARSNAKLWEHAQVGAVGLYPADWAPAAALGGGALRAAPHPDAWHAAITHAIATGSALEQSAQVASSRLSRCKVCAMQQSLWTDLLGIQSG